MQSFSKKLKPENMGMEDEDEESDTESMEDESSQRGSSSRKRANSVVTSFRRTSSGLISKCCNSCHVFGKPGWAGFHGAIPADTLAALKALENE